MHVKILSLEQIFDTYWLNFCWAHHDDSIVVLPQLRYWDMSADLNITNEPAATGPSQLSELVDHILQQHNTLW